MSNLKLFGVTFVFFPEPGKDIWKMIIFAALFAPKPGRAEGGRQTY